MGIHASTRVRLSAVAFLAALVAGCGGGGGGGVMAEPPAAPPVAPAPPPGAQLLDWDTHPTASVVLGQAGFADFSPGDLLNPRGSAAVTAGGALFVAVEGSGVKAFDDYLAGGAAAQRTIPVAGTAFDVAARGNRLLILHENSMAIFNDVSSSASDEPDLAFAGTRGCGPNQMNLPRGAFIAPTGQLLVADRGNHRVLIWNPEDVPSSSGPLPAPSVVVGQPNAITCTAPSGPSDRVMFQPNAVWSDGHRLIVADTGHNRILVWDQLPTEDFQAANWVIGQASFTSADENRGSTPSELTLASPFSVDVSVDGQLAVADAGNNRVLVWNSVPRAHSAPADHVLGQSNFSLNVQNDGDQNGVEDAPNGRTLDGPTGARFNGRNLIVTDRGNNRVLVFPASN